MRSPKIRGKIFKKKLPQHGYAWVRYDGVSYPFFSEVRVKFLIIGSQTYVGGFRIQLWWFAARGATPYCSRGCCGDLVDTFTETEGAGKVLWIEA